MRSCRWPMKTGGRPPRCTRLLKMQPRLRSSPSIAVPKEMVVVAEEDLEGLRSLHRNSPKTDAAFSLWERRDCTPLIYRSRRPMPQVDEAAPALPVRVLQQLERGLNLVASVSRSMLKSTIMRNGSKCLMRAGE